MLVLSLEFHRSSSINFRQMLLSDVVKRLRLLAPLQLAEKWDNVGLLIEGSADRIVENVLLTNDMSGSVLNEAVQKKCQMIISYHPIIFAPMKSLVRSDWKQRLVIDCIQSDISVFSPHTSWDCVTWMNNFHIVKCALGATENLLSKKASWEPVTSASFPSDKYFINSFTDVQVGGSTCELIYSLLSNLCASEGKLINLRTHTNGNGFDVITNFNLKSHVQVKPTSVTEADGKTLFGCGLKVYDIKDSREQEILDNVKHFLDLRYVRYSPGNGRTLESPIVSLAVCAGSGAGVLRGLFGSVNLVITGEMSHHEVLDAKNKGTSVILTEHSNCERNFLYSFRDTTKALNLLPGCELIVSETDKDPLDVL